MALPVTDGARLLRIWMNERGLNIPTFAARHGLNRVEIQLVCNGTRKRISIDFAMMIHRATDGAIPLDSWRSETARITGDGETAGAEALA